MFPLISTSPKCYPLHSKLCLSVCVFVFMACFWQVVVAHSLIFQVLKSPVPSFCLHLCSTLDFIYPMYAAPYHRPLRIILEVNRKLENSNTLQHHVYNIWGSASPGGDWGGYGALTIPKHSRNIMKLNVTCTHLK